MRIHGIASAWLFLGIGLSLFAMASCGRQQPASPELVLHPVVDEIPLAATLADERFDQLGPAVTALPGGGFAIAWQVGTFPARDVAVQWVTADGRPRLPPGGLSLGAAAEDEGRAVIAPDAASGAFVAYVRRHASGNSSQVVVHSLDDLGRARWPSEGVVAIEGPGWRMEAPHLTGDGSGGVFVCATAMTNRSDARCQRVDALGRPLWGPGGVDVGGPLGHEELPYGIADGTGGLLVFWDNQGDPMRIEGQRLAPDGASLWGPAGTLVHQTRLPGIGGFGDRTFGAVSDGQGGAVLTFHDLLPSLTVIAQRVTRDGALAWGSGVRAHDSTAIRSHQTTIGAGDGGAFVVVSGRSGGPGQNQLWVHRLGADGRQLWRETPLSDTATNTANGGAVGSYQDGVLWLAWTHQTALSSPDLDVRLARFERSGFRVAPPAGALVSGAPWGQFTQDAAFSAASGRFLVVYNDQRLGGPSRDSDVYAGLVRLEPR